MRLAAAAVGVGLLASLGPSPCGAQETVMETRMIPVADSVELRTEISRPSARGRHPVVLIRSPYSGPGSDLGWLTGPLEAGGYAVVVQAVRGTGGSAGEFTPFVHDAADGGATLDWIVEQPWAGPVGLWGVSYLGWSAYALAETGHPAIRALAVGSAWAELGPFLAPGGAFHLMAHVPWFIGFGPEGQGLPPTPVLHQILRTVPLASLFGNQEAVEAVAEKRYDWEAVDVPTLQWTGWYDYIYRDVLTAFGEMTTARPDVDRQLIIGPWAHNDELSGRTRVGPAEFGATATATADSVARWTVEFFDAHLRDGPAKNPPVRTFVLGKNRWRTFDQWPPRGAEELILHLTNEGLRAWPGQPSEATLRYDPNAPVPTVGGVLSHLFPDEIGPLDQSPLSSRADILRFESAPLDHDLTLAGPIRVLLAIGSDAPSTDVTAKLVQILPDGRAPIIEDGIRRIESMPKEGGLVVVVSLGARAMRIAAGTRLRLDISGGNFPKFDRNPNTGEDPFLATGFAPVAMTLSLGGDSGSRLELTVLPARAGEDGR